MADKNNSRTRTTLDQEPLFKTEPSIHKPRTLSQSESIQLPARANEIELLSRFEVLFRQQKNTIRALRHFYTYGCGFSKDLEKSINISPASSFRIMTVLNDAGFIEPLTKAHIPAKYGVKTILYGLPDVTAKEVQQAIARDMKYSSKSLKHVDIIYQRTLTEVVDEEIQMTKIMAIAKKYGHAGGFHFTDIARYVANKHQLDGTQVWRKP